ncbi:SIMPL domain-containing protein [Bacillus sp. CGMCC 1.16607]|uniref:SIMPL domain-containing protein n=1 Tax=Bacillus sp. CGMCC 1.16607 TaxID=3351842 RepID=UPI00363D9116
MYYNYPVSTFYRQQMGKVENKNIIRVNGEGVVTAVPNQATATIGVITEGKDLTEVQERNSSIVTNMMTVLNSFNIPKKNIQTYDYQVNTEYDYENGKQIFRGYRVQNLLKMTIDQIDELGKIINAIIKAGANYVSNVQFQVSNPEQYYLQALRKALKNAHEKAETIVSDLKVNWNSIPLRIEERGKETSPIHPQQTYVKAASTEQFQPGILQFTSSLVVTYQYFN